MGKRSDFKRVARDLYPTPPEAVIPLLPHLDYQLNYAEVCAGAADLVDALREYNVRWTHLSDIEPRAEGILNADFAELQTINADCVLTNPPFQWGALSELLDLCIQRWKKPCWLLLPADFIFNKRSAKYLRHCGKIVTIGRVKWIKDSKYTSKDAFVWAYFAPSIQPLRPFFYGQEGS